MGDEHLRSAVDRFESALGRIEAALARREARDNAALAAIEARHEALRRVLADSVHELDMLLAAAQSAGEDA